MKVGSIEVDNKRFLISRYNPKDIPLSGQMTPFLLIRKSEKYNNKKTLKDLIESDINKYFERFGKIVHCQWNDDCEAILKFQHYDIVDQIILSDGPHEINGIKIDVEKTRQTQTSNMMATTKSVFCIHVTNIPLDVTSEELSQIFNIHVADIVIKPGYIRNECLASKDQINSEAWIINIGNEKKIRDLASKNSKIKLRGLQIKCDVINEPVYPFELCRNFKTGVCKYQIKCQFKHIMCNQPETCPDEQCFYGHNRKRQVTSNVEEDNENCEKNFYRLRISNIPTTANKEELAKLLDIKGERISRIILKEDQDKNSSSDVAYLVHQRSVKYLQSRIYRLHDKNDSDDQSNKMKCQLEIDVDFYYWDDECHSNECFSTTNYNQTKESKSLLWHGLHTEQSNDNSSEEITDMEVSDEIHLKNKQILPNTISNDMERNVKYLLTKKYSYSTIQQDLAEMNVNISTNAISLIANKIRKQHRLDLLNNQNPKFYHQYHVATADIVRRITLCISKENPPTVRLIAARCNISVGTVINVIHNIIHAKCLKKRSVHQLNPTAIDKRRSRAWRMYLRLFNEKYKNYITTDEAWFYLDVSQGVQDICYVRSKELPDEIKIIQRNVLHPVAVMVWAGVCASGKTQLHFMEPGSITTSEYYIEHILQPFIKYDVPRLFHGNKRKEMVLHQDNALGHKVKDILAYMKENKIKVITPEEWLPKSPDAAPMDYSIWNILKEQVRKHKISTLNELKNVIKQEWENLEQSVIDDTLKNWPKRCRLIYYAQGSFIEHLLQ
ncbi:unnamed protein product [Rotaria sordida]|uniref:C3H1-type domain-containing protein n=1 Tax=Rotaria sordida TaxID=392033 RepID=A0A819FHE3_9BILA|nr:unnamed protein product [Rotaria sordida]